MDELLLCFSDIELEKSSDDINKLVSDAIMLYNIYIQHKYYTQEINQIEMLKDFNIKQIIDIKKELKNIENPPISVIKILQILTKF